MFTFSYLLQCHTWPTFEIGKNILDELKCLVEDASGAMRDISLVQDENLGDWLNEQACIDDKVVILPPFYFEGLCSCYQYFQFRYVSICSSYLWSSR